MIRYTLPPIPIRTDVSVLICHRNTPENIMLCIESLMTHYPDVEVVVLDGMSTDESRTYLKTRERLFFNLRVVDWTRDYHSHGVMMDYALREVMTTPFVWILDSGTIIRYRKEIPMQGYASGCIMMQSINNEGCAPASEGDSMKYVHPSCMVIDRIKYHKYRPFIDHGAPCVWNMIDAQEEEMYSWGEEHVLHLCGGSWTTPRTVWWHDFGVFVRPLVEEEWRSEPGRPPHDIVMWGEEPRVTGKYHDRRMEHNAWYIADYEFDLSDIKELEESIIEHGALEQFGPFIRRDVWQRKA